MKKNGTAVAVKTSILIVDDHPVVCQGLTRLINQQEDMEVTGQAGGVYEAMGIIRKNPPDMVVVDVSLKDANGIELIKDVRAYNPDIPMLTLSMHDESVYAERALRAGARGYIMKQEGTDKLVDAIRKVRAGHLYLSDKMSARMVCKLVGSNTAEIGSSPVDRLSDRELEVFQLIGKGHRTRQIAERLHLSVKTVETYRSHIKEKLNLADATELLQHAIQWVNATGRA